MDIVVISNPDQGSTYQPFIIYIYIFPLFPDQQSILSLEQILNVHPLEVVSRYHNAQLHVGAVEITLICLICFNLSHLKLWIAVARHNFTRVKKL